MTKTVGKNLGMAGFEIYRAIHEEIECIEDAASTVLMSLDGKANRVACDYALCFLVDSIQQRLSKLSGFHNDLDGTRSDEVEMLVGDQNRDIWSEFYSRVRQSKEYYKRNLAMSSGESADKSHWYQQALDYAKSSESHFSGEEGRGKYLDLTASHAEYCNLRKLSEFLRKDFLQSQWTKYLKKHPDSHIEFEEFRETRAVQWLPVDYITWLRSFDAFELIPRVLKYRNADYKRYLESLSGYLDNFVSRQRPLFDLSQMNAEFDHDFAERWDSALIPGWEQKTCESPLYAVVTDRLFSHETAMKGHISSKEYRKGYEMYEKLSQQEKELKLNSSIQQDRLLARLEEKVRYLRGLLVHTVSETIDHVTRKQARTSHEVARELAGLATEEAAEEDIPDNISELSSSGGEEVNMNDRAIYNPKNLPIGPDGKPIPYWQYKLFGLDKEFKCEICGNYSYFGRRAFEKHFSEWRHINGLRALRIQNSNHFFGVTGIEDAISISDKLRKQTSAVVFNADKEMECEDAMGNVMSYRAYQDLVRQGMI